MMVDIGLSHRGCIFGIVFGSFWRRPVVTVCVFWDGCFLGSFGNHVVAGWLAGFPAGWAGSLGLGG